MPNANAPFGLKPVRMASSSPFNDGADPHVLLAADNAIVYRGDPVLISGIAGTAGVPSATLATAGAGNRITGVVCGFQPTPTIIANGFRPAGHECHAYVEHDPDMLFEVMCNGNLAAADIGANANLIAGAGGNAWNESGWMLDSSSIGTGATLQLRIVGLARRPDNEFGQYAVALVRINQPTETGAAGSTGV